VTLVNRDPETWYLCPVCLRRHPIFLRYSAVLDVSYCACCGVEVTGEFMYDRVLRAGTDRRS
jgi:hypothetical protein